MDRRVYERKAGAKCFLGFLSTIVFLTLACGSSTVAMTPVPEETEFASTGSPRSVQTSTSRPAGTRTPATSSEETPQIRVIVNAAYVRSGPGTIYERISTVPRDEVLEVLATNNEQTWYNVRLSNGTTAWIGSTVVEPVSEALMANVQAAVTIPAPPTTIDDVINQPSSSDGSADQPPPGEPPPGNCDPAYPTVCIPSPPPDLDCRHIYYRNFAVLPPDPHGFDGDNDGIGCES